MQKTGCKDNTILLISKYLAKNVLKCQIYRLIKDKTKALLMEIFLQIF